MSYNCELCGDHVPNGPQVRIVTETRARTYPPRPLPDGGESRPGWGWEIATEKAVCVECAEGAEGGDQ